MAYSVANDVKPILQIATATLTYDTELTECITSADAWVDKKLEPYDLTVPTPVPQNIKDASRYFAAYLFRKRRDPTGADPFKDVAEEFLMVHVNDEQEIAFSVVNDQ